MLRKLMFVLIIVFILVPLVISGCSKPTPSPTTPPAPAPAPAPEPKPEPITLKFVNFLFLNQKGAIPNFLYLDKVQELSKGELIIDIAGGPEAIPQRELPEAVRSGAIDLAVSPPTFYRQFVPEAGAFSINRLPQKEQLPGTPWYDFAVEVHEKGGLRFLGESSFEEPFRLLCTKPVENPEGLKGLRFRSSPAYPFFEKIGITPITMDHAEVYSAAERGLIDGAPVKSDSVVNLSWYEIMKYYVGPGFWGTTNLEVIMNIDSWNKLPKHLQDIMVNAQLEIDDEKVSQNKEFLDGNMKIIYDNGVKHIEWSDEDNQWFLNTIDDVVWGRASQGLSPEQIAQMKKLMGF